MQLDLRNKDIYIYNANTEDIILSFYMVAAERNEVMPKLKSTGLLLKS